MDVSTVALNMTFLLTLGIGFLIFLAHILIFTTMLILAGSAHLAAMTFTALCNRLRMAEVTNHGWPLSPVPSWHTSTTSE